VCADLLSDEVSVIFVKFLCVCTEQLCSRAYDIYSELKKNKWSGNECSLCVMLCEIELQSESRCQKDILTRYKCRVCKFEFMSLFDRDEHLRTHVSEGVDGTAADAVVCKLCGEKCDMKTYSSTHLQRHPLIYFCSVCSAFFPSSVRLVRHLDVHQSLLSSSRTDVFWQSIACSVFLPRSDDGCVSWLSGSIDTVCAVSMLNIHRNSSLEDISRDMECTSVSVFAQSGTELLVGVDKDLTDVVEQSEETQVINGDMDNCTSSSFDCQMIDRDVCLQVGFKSMSRDIFIRLQQTFGGNECEYCGQLFFVQSDLDAHLNLHDGLFLFCLALLHCFLHGYSVHAKQ